MKAIFKTIARSRKEVVNKINGRSRGERLPRYCRLSLKAIKKYDFIMFSSGIARVSARVCSKFTKSVKLKLS